MSTALTHDALVDLDADLLICPVTDDTTEAWTEAFGPAFATAAEDARSASQAATFYPEGEGPRRVAVVAAADGEGLERWRMAAAAGAAAARGIKAASVVLAVPPGGDEAAETAAALLEGFRLGAYRFGETISDAPYAGPNTLRVHIPNGSEGNAAAALATADVRVEATILARDLVNRSPDRKVPALLAESVREAAEAAGMRVEVWKKDRIEEEGMGGLLAVNRGSLDPPRFVILEHAPKGHADNAPVVLVGKGVTYDTGGLSLKSTKGSMDKMKADMGGAAAVAGAAIGVARLGLPVRLITLIPMSDNRPGERAYVPGDVITMHDGTTVEVMNTDAEGRMLLADALSIAQRYAPRQVIDVATLTGAQVVALGSRVAAAVTRPDDDASVMERLREAGEATGDLVWPLPLFPHYKEQLTTDAADLCNIGGREAGTLTAAAFLEHFTRTKGAAGWPEEEVDMPAYPWLHLDIAGPSFLDAATGYRPKGGTGFGVRLLIYLLTRLSS